MYSLINLFNYTFFQRQQYETWPVIKVIMKQDKKEYENGKGRKIEKIKKLSRDIVSKPKTHYSRSKNVLKNKW